MIDNYGNIKGPPPKPTPPDIRMECDWCHGVWPNHDIGCPSYWTQKCKSIVNTIVRKVRKNTDNTI